MSAMGQEQTYGGDPNGLVSGAVEGPDTGVIDDGSGVGRIRISYSPASGLTFGVPIPRWTRAAS